MWTNRPQRGLGHLRPWGRRPKPSRGTHGRRRDCRSVLSTSVLARDQPLRVAPGPGRARPPVRPLGRGRYPPSPRGRALGPGRRSGSRPCPRPVRPVVNSKGMTRPAATASTADEREGRAHRLLVGFGNEQLGMAAGIGVGRRLPATRDRASAGCVRASATGARRSRAGGSAPAPAAAVASQVASATFGVSARTSTRLRPGRSSDSGRNI